MTLQVWDMLRDLMEQLVQNDFCLRTITAGHHDHQYESLPTTERRYGRDSVGTKSGYVVRVVLNFGKADGRHRRRRRAEHVVEALNVRGVE